MNQVNASRPRRSSEFWAIVGSGIAMGALVLTVSGWHRGDIAGLRAEIGGVRGDMERMEAGLRGDMERMEAGLRGDMERMEASLRGGMESMEAGLRGGMESMEADLRGDMESMEADLRGDIKALDESLSARIDKLQDGQAQIGARLAVLESHVLGTPPVAQWGTPAES